MGVDEAIRVDEDNELSEIEFWIAPDAETTNDEVLLLLLPMDVAAATVRIQADAVAEKKMNWCKERI